MIAKMAIYAAIGGLLALSIHLKTLYEVDYFVLESGKRKVMSPDDYFAGTRFKFLPSGADNEYVGMAGGCLIVVGSSNRDGDADAAFEQKHKSQAFDIYYLYKGELTTAAPYLRAQFEHYLEMLKVATGGKPSVHLLLHLAVSGACRAPDLLPLKIVSTR